MSEPALTPDAPPLITSTSTAVESRDILQLIFDQLATLGPAVQIPLTLVSREWNDAASHTPSLWLDIHKTCHAIEGEAVKTGVKQCASKRGRFHISLTLREVRWNRPFTSIPPDWARSIGSLTILEAALSTALVTFLEAATNLKAFELHRCTFETPETSWGVTKAIHKQIRTLDGLDFVPPMEPDRDMIVFEGLLHLGIPNLAYFLSSACAAPRHLTLQTRCLKILQPSLTLLLPTLTALVEDFVLDGRLQRVETLDEDINRWGIAELNDVLEAFPKISNIDLRDITIVFDDHQDKERRSPVPIQPSTLKSLALYDCDYELEGWELVRCRHVWLKKGSEGHGLASYIEDDRWRWSVFSEWRKFWSKYDEETDGNQLDEDNHSYGMGFERGQGQCSRWETNAGDVDWDWGTTGVTELHSVVPVEDMALSIEQRA